MLNPLLFLHVSESSLVMIPFLLLSVVGLLFVPSMLAPGAKPAETARAIVCALLQAVGVILVGASSISVLPVLLRGDNLSFEAFYAPLLFFVAGLLILVHFTHELKRLPAETAAVPRAIFLAGFELFGILITLFAGLSIALSALIGDIANEWQMSGTLLLAGLILAASCSQALRTGAPAKKKSGFSLRRKKR